MKEHDTFGELQITGVVQGKRLNEAREFKEVKESFKLTEY